MEKWVFLTVQEQLYVLAIVAILVQVLDAVRVEARTAANDAVHFVALFEQELREVRPILFRWGEWM